MGDFDNDSDDKTVVQHPTISHVAPTDDPNKNARTVVCLRCVSGYELGKLHILKPGELMMGRGEDCDFLLKDRNCSRNHARLVVSGQNRCFINDLGSTNGVFINGRSISSMAEVMRGDELKFSSRCQYMVEHHIHSEAVNQQALYEEANTDKLTKVYNRRFLESYFDYLKRMANQESEAKISIGFILFDIDFFKKVNDTYGHIGGDDALIQLSARIQDSLRPGDVFARVGGEEFVIVLQTSSKAQLADIAERVRILTESTPIATQGKTFPVNISLGTIYVPNIQIASYLELYESADKALYYSKENGRNQVTAADDYKL